METTCWVSMPFGQKYGLDGEVINFDQIYHEVIRPAIETVGLDAIRGDSDLGEILAYAALERAINSPVMIADITMLNPNVLYELGARDALRSSGTVILAGQGVRIPFDLQSRRFLHYPIIQGVIPVAEAPRMRAMISRAVEDALSSITSPIHEHNLVDSTRYRTDLGAAKSRGRPDSSLRQLAQRVLRLNTAAELTELLDIPQSRRQELVDYDPNLTEHILSLYNAAGLYDDALNFMGSLRPDQQAVRQVTQERAAILSRRNRPGDRERAISLLRQLIFTEGPNSETLGLLGRLLLDLFNDTGKEAAQFEAANYFREAFELDPTDAYTGMRAVDLLLRTGNKAEADELLPRVRSVLHDSQDGTAEEKWAYWDVAANLHLSVLAHDWPAAENSVRIARLMATEPWMLEATQLDLKNVVFGTLSQPPPVEAIDVLRLLDEQPEAQ